MKTFLLVSVLFVAGYAWAQTCIIPAPPTPPVATQLHCNLPVDGGTAGCTCYGTTPNGATPTPVAVSNAKCSQAVQIAKQSVANDNGWSDGGAP